MPMDTAGRHSGDPLMTRTFWVRSLLGAMSVAGQAADGRWAGTAARAQFRERRRKLVL